MQPEYGDNGAIGPPRPDRRCLLDADGNLTSRTDSFGRGTSYTRAPDDSRLTGITYTAGNAPNVSFTYDAYDRVATMTDGTGTTTYAYDDLDNLISVTTYYSALPAGHSTFTISYGYTNDGRRASMGTPVNTFSYAYWADGRLKDVFSPWTGEHYSYLYYSNGWLQKQTAPRCITTLTYNARGQIIDLLNKWGSLISDPILSEFSNMAYDGMGYLILDASTNSGQPFLFSDPIGGQGQQGVYTDYETRPNPSATGLALVAQNYYDASLARRLNRSSGGLNEYEAATLPYRVFSNIGKGILNGAWGMLLDSFGGAVRQGHCRVD